MNRKELLRQYKDTPRPMGVYCVRNVANGDVFIGRSVNLPAALNRHRFGLAYGNHRNRTLQEQWDAAGESAFAFEVLDTLEPEDAPGYDPSEDLEVLEAAWFEKLTAGDGHGSRLVVHKA